MAVKVGRVWGCSCQHACSRHASWASIHLRGGCCSTRRPGPSATAPGGPVSRRAMPARRQPHSPEGQDRWGGHLHQVAVAGDRLWRGGLAQLLPLVRARQGRPHVGGARDLVQQRVVVQALVRLPPRPELPEHDAEGVDVHLGMRAGCVGRLGAVWRHAPAGPGGGGMPPPGVQASRWACRGAGGGRGAPSRSRRAAS